MQLYGNINSLRGNISSPEQRDVSRLRNNKDAYSRVNVENDRRSIVDHSSNLHVQHGTTLNFIFVVNRKELLDYVEFLISIINVSHRYSTC